MIDIRRHDVETTCSICGRTLLLGERLLRYQTTEIDRARTGADEIARVCVHCIDTAEARGWTREGAPPPPPAPEPPRRLRRLFARRRHTGQPVPFEPELLPDDPRETVEAGLELFNESDHRRTVAGVARTLGHPHVSVVRRSPRELVVTVAWDLSWYQYRVDMIGARPVTLQRRGDELAELEERFQKWNAQAEPDGSVALAASA